MEIDWKKKYEEAQLRMRQYVESGIIDAINAESIFPELAESEDEKIRKELLEEIEFIIPHEDETNSEGVILPSYHTRIDRYKSYLEKQKEQKPEWSEEDEEIFNNIIEKAKGGHWIEVNEITWLINSFKSLRLKPHWKPSEEQMDRLFSIVAALRKDYCDDMADFLSNLYADLKKLM